MVNYKPRKPRAKKERRTRKPTIKKTAIQKIVKREIALNVENKCRQYIQSSLNLYGQGASNANLDTSNILILSPHSLGLDIFQGTNQGARIGNRIKLKSLHFKGTLVPLPTGTNYAAIVPLQIKMFFFYDKDDGSAIPTPNTNGDFFQFNGTSLGVADSLTSLWMPVNNDRYRLLATKTFKLGWQTVASTGTGANGILNYANNDFKLNQNFSINLLKHAVSNVLFKDNNGDPTTRGIFCFITCLSATGSPIGSGQVANIKYMLDCQYEDA